MKYLNILEIKIFENYSVSVVNQFSKRVFDWRGRRIQEPEVGEV